MLTLKIYWDVIEWVYVIICMYCTGLEWHGISVCWLIPPRRRRKGPRISDKHPSAPKHVSRYSQAAQKGKVRPYVSGFLLYLYHYINSTNFYLFSKNLIWYFFKSIRELGDYEVAPFLDTLIDHSPNEDVELADCTAFVVGGFHTTGTTLTW